MRKPECINNMLENLHNGIKSHKTEFLIGLIDATDLSYCELINFTRALINKDIYVPRNEKSAIISIALVLFAIREYQNGQFWSEFAARLELDEAEVVKIGRKSFEEFCKKNDLYFHIGNKNKGYVTSILTHAILPDVSMPRFFEFLQDLYFRDLEEDYIDAEVEELIQYMHRLFTKYLEDEDISLIVQGSKMTIANQQLPKAFRIAFIKAANIVVPIIERLLYYLNQINYGEVVEYLENDRFDKNFEKYSYVVNERVNKLSKSGHEAEKIKKFQNAQYYFNNGKLYLQIPKQIIDSDYIVYDIYMEVFNDKSVIHREKALLTKSRLFFKTEQAEVLVPNFYSQLSFRIVGGNKTIYSSGDILHREFLIFDLEGNEISPKRLTDDTVKVITCAECDVLSDDAQIDVDFISNYRISTVFLNEESLLLINDKVFSTNVTFIKNEVCSKVKYNGVVIRDSSKKNFDVYSDIPDIRLRIPYEKRINDFIISINNKNYPLVDIADFEIRLISDGSGDELGIIYLHEHILVENNPMQIIIREKGSNRIYIDDNIFVLKSLYYEFGQKYYFKEKIAEIVKLESKEIEFTRNIELPAKVNIRINNFFKTEFSFNANIYQLLIELPLLKWRLGSFSYTTNRSNDIWWEDVDERKLFIKYPPGFSSLLHVITGTSYEKIDGKKIGDEYRYSLEHLFLIKNQEPITFGVLLDRNEERITKVHFNPVICDFSVSYSDRNNLLQGLYAQWKYIGRKEFYIDIIYSPTRKIIKQYLINGNKHLMDNSIELYYGEHEIEIYQLIEDDFFGSGTEKRVLLHEKFIVGDPVVVYTKNKILKGIYCISDNERFELINFYLKDIRFSKKRGFYEATGMYFIMDRNTGKEREWYFTKYNPFIIKPVCLDKDKLIFEVVDRDNDGLIYDVKTKYINPKEEKQHKNRYKLVDEIELKIVK